MKGLVGGPLVVGGLGSGPPGPPLNPALGGIVSSLSGVWGGAPETLFGHFVRNSVRFYVCFSALWKLAVMDNNTKSRPTRK